MEEVLIVNNNTLAFFELLRAGLWEKEARLSQFKNLDYATIMQLAEEQSVVGLVTAGLEYVTDIKVPKEELLQFIGHSLHIDQMNQAMNEFVAKLLDKLRKEDVNAILVKGQGIAQCYAKPLWRSCGDIDLLLSNENYDKAKAILEPLAESTETEFKQFKHYGMTIKGWVVELHGTLRPRLSKQIDTVVDEAQKDIFYSGNVRSWDNGGTTVFLPAPNNDIIFLFTHILKHFYQGGIGLRQICDWSRFLYVYYEEIDNKLLESRLKKMGIVSEWKAFAALAVEWLGMPVEVIPLYSSDKKWIRKAVAIYRFVLEVGNFGKKRDNNYCSKYPYIISKAISLWRRTTDSLRHLFIFPLNSVKVWWTVLVTGIKQI